MGLRWERTPSDALGTLAEQYADLIQRTAFDICQRFVPEIEAWMKSNAPWTDRTANARQSLWADVDQIARSAIIVILSHGVSYGEFLEFSHGSQYAIIGPALDHFAPRIWAAIRREIGIRG